MRGGVLFLLSMAATFGCSCGDGSGPPGNTDSAHPSEDAGAPPESGWRTLGTYTPSITPQEYQEVHNEPLALAQSAHGVEVIVLHHGLFPESPRTSQELWKATFGFEGKAAAAQPLDCSRLLVSGCDLSSCAPEPLLGTFIDEKPYVALVHYHRTDSGTKLYLGFGSPTQDALWLSTREKAPLGGATVYRLAELAALEPVGARGALPHDLGPPLLFWDGSLLAVSISKTRDGNFFREVVSVLAPVE